MALSEYISIDIMKNQNEKYLYTNQYDVGKNFIFCVNENGVPLDLRNYGVAFRLNKPDGTFVLNSCELSDYRLRLFNAPLTDENKYKIEMGNTGSSVIGYYDYTISSDSKSPGRYEIYNSSGTKLQSSLPIEQSFNQVYVTETDQMTMYDGIHDFSLTIANEDGEVISTITGKLVVMPSPTVKTIESKNESGLIESLLSGIYQLNIDCTAAQTNISNYLHRLEEIDNNVTNFISMDRDDAKCAKLVFQSEIAKGETRKQTLETVSEMMRNARFLYSLMSSIEFNYESSTENLDINQNVSYIAEDSNLLGFASGGLNYGGLNVYSIHNVITVEGTCTSSVVNRWLPLAVVSDTSDFERSGVISKELDYWVSLYYAGTFSRSAEGDFYKTGIYWYGYDEDSNLKKVIFQKEQSFGRITKSDTCLSKYGASQLLGIPESELRLGFLLCLDADPGDTFELNIYPQISIYYINTDDVSSDTDGSVIYTDTVQFAKNLIFDNITYVEIKSSNVQGAIEEMNAKTPNAETVNIDFNTF